jgi:hypothetical protein
LPASPCIATRLHVATQQLERDVGLRVACLDQQQIPGVPHFAHRATAEPQLEPVALAHDTAGRNRR